jgi:hypothetical protein
MDKLQIKQRMGFIHGLFNDAARLNKPFWVEWDEIVNGK